MSNAQTFRQLKVLTPEVMEKLLKSKQEAELLTMRDIHCPYCGYLVDKVCSDISGHKQIYCKKCKQEYLINLGYFRRQKKLKYCVIKFPDKSKKPIR